MTICSCVSVLFRHTLISLDASLRYPVTPDVSSRPRRAALFVVGPLSYVLILFPYLFSHRWPMEMTSCLCLKPVEFPLSR